MQNPKDSKVLATSPAGGHYKDFGIEPIVYTEANNLGFHEGNIIKYVTRWRLKNGVEDLKKARFYIDRLIELEERTQIDSQLAEFVASKSDVINRIDASLGHRDPGDETSGCSCNSIYAPNCCENARSYERSRED